VQFERRSTMECKGIEQFPFLSAVKAVFDAMPDLTPPTFYVVHLDRKAVAPETTYEVSAMASRAFVSMLTRAGYTDAIPGCSEGGFGFGYDDVSYVFITKADAIDFARRMDAVIPGATKDYRMSYMMGNPTHHAMITEYTSLDDPDPSVSYGPFDAIASQS